MDLINRIRSLSDSNMIPTPDGAFTFKENEKFIHSSRSPIKEAERLLSKITSSEKNQTVVLLWGVGLGYHTEMLIKQGYHVIAIEPRPKTATVFKKIFPMEQLLAFVEDNPEDIFNALVNLNPALTKTFIDIRMLGMDIDPIYLKRAEQGKNALRSTHTIYSYLMDSWHKHILINIQHAHVTFDPIFKDQEVIICSAGPSLRESLPYIKKLSTKLIILAVDTALKTLLEADIIPDYVFSVDAKIHNIGDFCGISEDTFSQITLLADITVSPQISSLAWKQVLYTSTVQPHTTDRGLIMKRIILLDCLKDIGICFPELQTGGSVANTAFHATIFYQAKKILLVGQDLAYTNHRGHATGSPYDQEYRLTSNRLNTLDTIHIQKVPFDMETPSILGKMTYSDELLMQFKSWFETSVQLNPELCGSVINASENGAYFNGWNHQTLSQYQSSSKKTNLFRIIPQKIDQKTITTFLDLLKNEKITIDSTNEIIKEYFYKELHSNIKTINIQQKIKRLQKILEVV
ncbi:MAG: motility associated factor glycosyltransferase family protein [Brevinema sp.]